MRSPNQATWSWGDILAASGESDAALRRKVQRNQVAFDAQLENGRVRANIWDVARLRVSRYLSNRFEAKEAFALASNLVSDGYSELIKGRTRFTDANGKKQAIIFVFWPDESGADLAPLTMQIDPGEGSGALAQLGREAGNPGRFLVPLHHLVLEAWEKLPDLPEGMDSWVKASRENHTKLFR